MTEDQGSSEVAKMAHVLRGMVERGHTIDLEAIDRAATLATYRQDPTDEDRAWAVQAALSAPPVDQSRGEAVAWRWKMAGDRIWTVGLNEPVPYAGQVAEPLYAALSQGGENG